jgi:hypothetical protein
MWRVGALGAGMPGRHGWTHTHGTLTGKKYNGSCAQACNEPHVNVDAHRSRAQVSFLTYQPRDAVQQGRGDAQADAWAIGGADSGAACSSAAPVV